MHRFCPLLLAFYIGFAGVTVCAQPLGTDALESIRQSLTPSENSEGLSLLDRMNALSTPPETPDMPPAEEAPIIEVPLIPDSADIPAVNQGTAAVLDTRGRYAARLKINLADFPLRLLNKPETKENVISADAIALRMKNRLHLSELHLTVENRKATVSGITETPHQRDMITVMLRFVPGIDTVQNKIRVSPSPQ